MLYVDPRDRAHYGLSSQQEENTMPDEMNQELERLRAEIAKLKAKAETKSIHFKVSPKGGVSVYGLQHYPVTLYQEQWLTLLDHADDIKQFITENLSKLKAKGE